VEETVSNSNVTLTQGFQQPNYSLSPFEEHPEFNYSISVFPNPVVDILNIETIENVEFELNVFDLNGKILFNDKLSHKMEINLSGYSKGTYFLRILSPENKEVKLYKIQKIR